MDIKPEEWDVSHEWKTVVPYGIDCLYSNQFKIKHIEDIVFTIAMKFNETKTHLETWVIKSTAKPLKATVCLSVKDKCKKKSQIDEWKENCLFENFLAFPSQLVPCQVFDSIRGVNFYVYEVTIDCKIILHDYKPDFVPDFFYENLLHFRKSHDLSDVTLIVGDVEIPAHKVIIAAHSPIFKAMLLSDMKEAKKGVIEIKGLKEDVIVEMLNYFYTGETKASFDTELALQMIEVADIYQIMRLKNICEMTLLKNMSIDNIVDIIDVADDHNIEKLRKEAIKFMPELMFELMKAVGKKK
ncbi:uncharacterized protein LOC103579705 [Microplitis demolitor]|uniref:uncharacterized protein LOC103579705 n=1 Tax=Microplitis demolitor TaxID=69319 RepID=UPI00235B6DAD|nr:uncharacterized protein LOC103579705 [Microplitis demolitor]